MEAELSGLLGGVKVDLRTPNDLSRYFREEVQKRAEVQFARWWPARQAARLGPAVALRDLQAGD